MCSNWWCHDPNQPHRDHLLYFANFTPNELLDVVKLIPVNQPLTEWDNKRVFKTFWTIIAMKKLRFWEFISYRKGDLWYKALTEWGKMWREIWSKITNLPQILTRSLPPFLPSTCPHSSFPPLGRSNFFWLPQITITLPPSHIEISKIRRDCQLQSYHTILFYWHCSEQSNLLEQLEVLPSI